MADLNPAINDEIDLGNRRNSAHRDARPCVCSGVFSGSGCVCFRVFLGDSYVCAGVLSGVVGFFMMIMAWI